MKTQRDVSTENQLCVFVSVRTALLVQPVSESRLFGIQSASGELSIFSSCISLCGSDTTFSGGFLQCRYVSKGCSKYMPLNWCHDRDIPNIIKIAGRTYTDTKYKPIAQSHTSLVLQHGSGLYSLNSAPSMLHIQLLPVPFRQYSHNIFYTNNSIQCHLPCPLNL